MYTTPAKHGDISTLSFICKNVFLQSRFQYETPFKRGNKPFSTNKHVQFNQHIERETKEPFPQRRLFCDNKELYPAVVEAAPASPLPGRFIPILNFISLILLNMANRSFCVAIASKQN